MSKTKLRPCQNRDEAAEWVGKKVVGKSTGNVYLINMASNLSVHVNGASKTFQEAFDEFGMGVEVPIEIEWRDCTIADLVNGPVEGRVRDDDGEEWSTRKIYGYVHEDTDPYVAEDGRWWKQAQVPVESEAAS